MHNGIWIAVAIVLLVAVYVLAKVVHYARLSRKQWQEVDKSKLRQWEEDDDW